MKTQKQDLGKVSLTCNGTWDAGKQYDRLCIVNDGNFASYISKKFVPSGTPLSNIEYWQPLASLKDDIKINYEKFKKEVLQLIADIQIALRGTRLVVQNEAERNELTWMQVAVGCEVYEIDSKLTYILDKIVPILNIKEWHLESDSRIDSVPMYELEGTFDNLTSDRAIADRWGHIIDEYYVTRDMVNNYIKELVQKYVHEFTILPGSIKPEDLSQAVLDLIGHDSITNLADEEDITDHTNANGIHVLKFKDKDYYESDGSGLGRVYLRQNKVQGVNTLTQDMISKPNTIYHIQYDYTLREQTIEIPENCILKFEGGSLNCGIIKGNNTNIDKDNGFIFDNINIRGTWNVPIIQSNFFKNLDITNSLQEVINLSNADIQNTIIINNGEYKVSVSVNNGIALSLNSNTKFILNGNIILEANSFNNYSILEINSCENVHISGNGSITGDSITHTGTTGEWGMGINILGSKNISIIGIKVNNCWGDSIYIGNNNTNTINISKCFLDGSRRQGISITNGENITITDCIISNINGTSPKAGIDVEPNAGEIITNVLIQNVKVSDSYIGIMAYARAQGAIINSVSFVDCYVDNVEFAGYRLIGEGIKHGVINSCVSVNSGGYPIEIRYVDNFVIDSCKLITEATDVTGIFEASTNSGIITNCNIVASEGIGVGSYVNISNNTIKSTTSVLNQHSFSSVTYITFDGNTCYGPLLLNSSNIKIINNIFKDNISGTCSNSIIDNNEINRLNGTYINSIISNNKINGSCFLVIDKCKIDNNIIEANTLVSNLLCQLSGPTNQEGYNTISNNTFRYNGDTEGNTLLSIYLKNSQINNNILFNNNRTSNGIKLESVAIDNNIFDNNIIGIYNTYTITPSSINLILDSTINNIKSGTINRDGTSISKVKFAYSNSDFNFENYIYRITKDIDLQGASITIPNNCTLDFQGGSISNGTVTFNNTRVIQQDIENYITATIDGSYKEGQILYDSVLKKMILFNGTDWVNLDGTTLA